MHAHTGSRSEWASRFPASHTLLALNIITREQWGERETESLQMKTQMSSLHYTQLERIILCNLP